MRAWLRRTAHAATRDVLALWLALRDPRVPLAAKLMAAVVVGYALSPIDLIPDFIPVLGYLDDLVLVPLGVWLTLRLIPPELMDELRRRAATELAGRQPRSLTGAVAVVLIWLLLIGLLLRMVL